MNLLLHMNTGKFFRHSGEACPGRQSAGGRNPAYPLFNWIGADGIPAFAGMMEFLLREHSLNIARHLISEKNVFTETKTQALARPAGGNAAEHRASAMGAPQSLWPRE